MRRAMSAVVAGFVCFSVWIALPGRACHAGEIWLDVPFVRQSRNGCGSASVAMLIQYWDMQTRRDPAARQSETDIYRKLYSTEARGILAARMQQYLEAEGFRVFVFGGRWQDLQGHLSKGRPLIVCLKNGAALHYTVVTGIDPAQGIVLINDPAGRKLQKMTRADFEKGWKGSDNWTLMAVP